MPLHISERTLAMLEWREFLVLYSAFVSSSAAREKITDLGPVENLKEELQLSHEALLCAHKQQIPALNSLENILELIHKTAIENTILDGVELNRIGKLAALNNEIRNHSGGWKMEFPLLHARGTKLPDLRKIEQEIQDKLDPSGEVKEDATPELKHLRKQIAHLKSKAENALERYLKDKRYQNALQEDYVTYRHGRAVLVVRADQKSAIRGVIHGESGSGASLFLEPLNVLELNNELAQLTDRKLQETTRILKELTAQTGKEADLLLLALQRLIELDLIFARGRYGKAFRCVIPEITEDLRVVLENARHPVLEAALQKQQKPLVPVSFKLDSVRKVLVITGPNTGGKTVFLKTAGLLSLMAHCALPIPASEGSLIPHFSSIDADIGDQQSISESLSTFSSHINNIDGILSKLKERSLILLDELGTGTDPEEGAPLAVAIVQELLKHNVKAIVTSHHSQMKVFAFNHPECQTAAMEFDQQNLQPTYRVLIDQIGASHAFDIAQRLGFPLPILERARSLLDEGQKQVQRFQELLHQRIRTLEAKQEALEKEKTLWQTRATQQQEQLEKARLQLENQLARLKDTNTDLIRIVNAKVEGLLKSIKEAQDRQSLRKQYKEEVAPVMEQIRQLTAADDEVPPQEWKPGERVWVNLYKDFGELISIRKDQAELLIRNKRFTVPVTSLERKESIAQSLPKGVQFIAPEKHVEPELKLIGQTVEEALALADKYLDDAFLGQLPEVRIIHGHGMGKLKKAIETFLSTHPHVRRFHPESQQHGGSGVTVVELETV